MKRLSRKNSLAIATIFDALRELRIRGENAIVEMYSEEIRIKAYPDTEKEARYLKKILCFFKDEDDDIGITHFPASEGCANFYKVELRKWLVCDSE